MIAFVRVDNRLIHGQVVEAWLPKLHVSRVLVADDEAASHPLTRAAMGLAVPPPTTVQITALNEADLRSAEASPERILLLVRDVDGARAARERGLTCPSLNLGNVHFAPGRVAITSSVFLSANEVAALKALSADGVAVEVRAVPKDKPLTLPDIEARAEAALRGK